MKISTRCYDSGLPLLNMVVWCALRILQPAGAGEAVDAGWGDKDGYFKWRRIDKFYSQALLSFSGGPGHWFLCLQTSHHISSRREFFLSGLDNGGRYPLYLQIHFHISCLWDFIQYNITEDSISPLIEFFLIYLLNKLYKDFRRKGNYPQIAKFIYLYQISD